MNLQKFWDKTYELIEKNLSTLTLISNDLHINKTLDNKYFEKIILNDSPRISGTTPEIHPGQPGNE